MLIYLNIHILLIFYSYLNLIYFHFSFHSFFCFYFPFSFSFFGLVTVPSLFTIGLYLSNKTFFEVGFLSFGFIAPIPCLSSPAIGLFPPSNPFFLSGIPPGGECPGNIIPPGFLFLYSNF